MSKLSDSLTLYKPLIIISLIALAMATALQAGDRIAFMNAAMGLFLSFLAGLQLFNLGSFAMVFARYDPIASRWRPYGRLYPFIELTLAALYLSGIYPLLTNIVMFFIMIVGTYGVLRAIRSGQKLECACAGTAFKLPVGWVTVAENSIMGLMALVNILHLM